MVNFQCALASRLFENIFKVTGRINIKEDDTKKKCRWQYEHITKQTMHLRLLCKFAVQYRKMKLFKDKNKTE